MAQFSFKEMFNNPTVKHTAVGLGVAVLIPVAVTYLVPLVKPVARSTVKIGLVTIEKGREIAAEFGEIFDDLVAEVREEMRSNRTTAESLLDDAMSRPSPAEGRTVAGIQADSEQVR